MSGFPHPPAFGARGRPRIPGTTRWREGCCTLGAPGGPHGRRVRRTLVWSASLGSGDRCRRRLCGCPRPPLPAKTEPPPDAGPKRPTLFFATNRNVDLLFLIDDSPSMRLSQDNLRRNFPVLMQTLENLPGGLPNIHVAVVSSDMGAGDGSVASCDSTGGRNGIFQHTARGDCTASGLASGATYISNIAGAANYSGTLPDVFTCIAALGEAGCGFEHQFAAITRALGVDGRPVPAENQGFLRPDALLAIVMITNEDDCSAVAGVPIFDTGSSTNIESQLGPPTNFRCNEFGHFCDGNPPKRRAPNNDVNASVSYENCTSRTTPRFLLPVIDIANQIKSLKGDDGQIMVAAITGPQEPYVVTWKTPKVADRSCGAASCPWPQIAHSCMAADGSFADPAVRIAELVGQFRRERPPAIDLRRKLRAGAEQHRRQHRPVRQRALHPGADREAPRHDARRLHRRQQRHRSRRGVVRRHRGRG